MRTLAAMATVAVVAALMSGCGDREEERVEPSEEAGHPGEAPAASQTPSPQHLRTLGAPSAPPTAPTDVVPGDVVTGRVSALTPGCLEVTTDDGAVWSLSGDPAELAVDDVVLARVEELAADVEPCGSGRAAALVSVRAVS